MDPAHPPFPTASNLPFHPVCGNQTSTLMSESSDGVRVAATRQNAGSEEYGEFELEPTGSVSAPAVTLWASVSLACGSATAPSASHDVWLPPAMTTRGP